MSMDLFHLLNPELQPLELVARTIETTKSSGDSEKSFTRVVVIPMVNDQGGQHRSAFILLILGDLLQNFRYGVLSS